ncbi:hypothetical protein AB434_1517 [Heyndrickxia coagulans]|uniref:Uncharacterized protein n=1 Tax=Heyndrickxia coagulans TaxID=1398 RepID=A0AAN0WDN0_HEYCO|nr:hypothetical protein SB48_HM08orf06090 [Heyndrickxia coagulans]AKN53922.1 hypothetical protein AB434_1517 [Heyndrickxia coagulans]KYC66311.1 hypothetical protein B4100_1037 [Heyndrickxia coagulans]
MQGFQKDVEKTLHSKAISSPFLQISLLLVANMKAGLAG